MSTLYSQSPASVREAPILRTDGLFKRYRTKTAVDGISLEVRAGEVVGLLGANGAGKTTTFRMTCGLIPADAGTVWLNGIDVTRWPMYRRAKEGRMGYLPQERSTFGSLSTEDNLYLVAQLLGMSRSEQKKRCEEVMEKFNLIKVRKTIVGNGSTGGLSGGERRRLEIARAMLTDPAIIMLDEPFANVDPKTVDGFQKVILSLTKEGIAILITDHNVSETLTITNRSYVIDNGRVLCSGTPLEVYSNEEARATYFGDGTFSPEQFVAALGEKRKQLLASLSEDSPTPGDDGKKSPPEQACAPARAKKPDRGFVADDVPADDRSFTVRDTSSGNGGRRSLRRSRRDDAAFDEFVDDPTEDRGKRRSLGLKRDE